MIIILKSNPDKEQLEGLTSWLESQGVSVHPTVGASQTVLGLVGDTRRIDVDLISALDFVDSVKRVQEPFKDANRKFHPEDTVIKVGNTQVGGGTMTVMAGPCSVESEEQLLTIARAVKASGATMLRGGAFKPRSSPYSFQGMKIEGIRLLLKAKEETGLPIVSEIMDASQLPLFDNVDVLQVGARNMQNFSLLKALGQTRKPILLKRGLCATYEEWLMSAEYILAGGNPNVILCERGIRTYETYTRNTLDIACVPVLRQLTHLPIVLDPSHAAGKASLIPDMACAAIAAGADGLEIEVHHDPAHARSDGPQALVPEVFDKLMRKLTYIKDAVDRADREIR